MRIINFIVLFILSTLSYSYEVNAASYRSLQRKCENIMKDNPTKIRVYYNFGNLYIDETKTTDQIKEIYKQHIRETNLTVNGVTLFNEYNKMNLSAKQVPLDDNYYCIYPETINYFIGYEDTKLYLSSEMLKDSCRYNQVKRHEENHIDFAHITLLISAKSIKNKLQEITKELKPTISNDPQENQAQVFIKIYNDLLQPTINVFRGALVQQQQQLDTLENYEYETSICPQ